MHTSMTLKVLIPHRVLLEISLVKRMVIETQEGSYGLLPNRLDCAAALTQGILTYETEDGEEMYIAVDEGVMVKTGNQVVVSVRRGFVGADLGELEALVIREFKKINEREESVKKVLVKLESDFVRRYSEVRHG